MAKQSFHYRRITKNHCHKIVQLYKHKRIKLKVLIRMNWLKNPIFIFFYETKNNAEQKILYLYLFDLYVQFSI